MKKRILVAALAAALTIAFWGCSLLSVSIEDRVNSFIGGLNADRSALYENFHLTATEDYAAIRASVDFFDFYFPDSITDYTLTGLDTSDSLNVTAFIDGTGYGGPMWITFQMIKDGMDWYIEEIDLEGGANPIVK